MAPRRVVRRTVVHVEFHHVDMMRVVHNSQYFRWFERGRLAVLEEVMPMSWAVENRIATPVVVNHAEYLWPASYGDELVVTTIHTKLPLYSGRFRFAHSISHAHNKRELCRGHTEVAVLDMGAGRLVKELPEPLWTRYLDLR